MKLADSSMITFTDTELQVHFNRFDNEAYRTFLQVKRIPEFRIDFDRDSETYLVSAPKRFASLLGIKPPEQTAEVEYSPFLFDDQQAITKMAIDAKRFACWSDCGLGKTLIQLEWCRIVMHKTGGRVLIVTMNDIVPQTIQEASVFYESSLPVQRLNSREELIEFCKGAGPGLAITNYEKFNPVNGEQVINEVRHLAGIALDESSRLKTGGGKQKWAIIKSTKGIEYKLSCTATPAPNDVMEFASQAAFLEKMRTESDIIWTYFQRDEKTRRWTVKKHARKAFFEFMATWSIYVRDPRAYGWRKDHPEIPQPLITVHDVPPTVEQMKYLAKLSSDDKGQQAWFQTNSSNAIQRGRLSQIAKGFIYRKKVTKRGVENAQFRTAKSSGRVIEHVPSLKPGLIADIIESDVKECPVLVWTVLDAEIDILSRELKDRSIEHAILNGSTTETERLRILDSYKDGHVRVLLSRASMLGYGINMQHVGSMIFSGWNDSFEQYYQALRRAYRHGQTRRLKVHIPVIRDLEGDMLDNIFTKEREHLSAIQEMEENYVRARRLVYAD